jgi:hypothetical protein
VIDSLQGAPVLIPIDSRLAGRLKSPHLSAAQGRVFLLELLPSSFQIGISFSRSLEHTLLCENGTRDEYKKQETQCSEAQWRDTHSPPVVGYAKPYDTGDYVQGGEFAV